jgi:hypothetical protein
MLVQPLRAYVTCFAASNPMPRWLFMRDLVETDAGQRRYPTRAVTVKSEPLRASAADVVLQRA